MKGSKKDKERQYSITVRATAAEREQIQQKADAANKSISRFLVDLAVTSETSHQKEAFCLAQRVIKMQRLIDDVENQVLQHKLRKECEVIWRG
ncbi:MAG: hypothetical protein IJ411_02860 [Oscillospiraceae bacterium]|nr:hypothetical protein [Oscillospiraceae bacterium]